MEARELIRRITDSVDLRHGGVSPTLAIAVKAWTGANISTATIQPDGVKFMVYDEGDAREILEAYAPTAFTLNREGLHHALHVAAAAPTGERDTV